METCGDVSSQAHCTPHGAGAERTGAPGVTTEGARLQVCSAKHLDTLCLPGSLCLPEGHRGDLPHEGIRSDTLQVEQGTICQEQDHQVLAVAEAGPAPPNRGHVLGPEPKAALLPAKEGTKEGPCRTATLRIPHKHTDAVTRDGRTTSLL